MINTHNKAAELHSVMLARVADLPLFVCIWRKAGRRGEKRAGRRILGS